MRKTIVGYVGGVVTGVALMIGVLSTPVVQASPLAAYTFWLGGNESVVVQPGSDGPNPCEGRGRLKARPVQGDARHSGIIVTCVLPKK